MIGLHLFMLQMGYHLIGCNFKGKAIYTDVDMINAHDIGELYDCDMQAESHLLQGKVKRWGYEHLRDVNRL